MNGKPIALIDLSSSRKRNRSDRLRGLFQRLAAPMHTVIVRGLEMVTAIVAGILFARYLGAEGLGVLTLAFSIAGILAIFMLFGTDTIAIRMYSTNRHEPQKVIGAALVLLAAGSVVCVFLCAFICWVMDLTSLQSLIVALAVVKLGFNGIVSVFSQAIISYDNSRYGIPAIIFTRVLHITGLVVCLQYGGLVDVMLVYIGATLLLAFLNGIIVHKKCFALKPRVDLHVIRELWSGGWRVGLASIFGNLSARADVLLLKMLASTQVVGIYGAAYRIINGATAGIVALAEALYPRVAKEITNNKRTIELKLYVAIPICVLLGSLIAAAFFSHFIVDLLYGEAFHDAAGVMQLLFIVLGLDAVFAFYGRFLVATHRENWLPKVQAIGAVVNIGLNFVFIPQYGAWGAALASVISFAVSLLCFLIQEIWYRLRTRDRKPADPQDSVTD